MPSFKAASPAHASGGSPVSGLRPSPPPHSAKRQATSSRRRSKENIEAALVVPDIDRLQLANGMRLGEVGGALVAIEAEFAAVRPMRPANGVSLEAELETPGGRANTVPRPLSSPAKRQAHDEDKERRWTDMAARRPASSPVKRFHARLSRFGAVDATENKENAHPVAARATAACSPRAPIKLGRVADGRALLLPRHRMRKLMPIIAANLEREANLSRIRSLVHALDAVVERTDGADEEDSAW